MAFAPLIIFMAILRLHPAPFPERWAHAYTYALLPALLFAIIAIVIFAQSDRLWLGLNAYFVFLGALASVGSWRALEVIGDGLKESGGFLVTCLVGLASIYLSRGGFIGASSAPEREVKRYSWILLAVAVAVFAFSYLNQGSRLWAIVVPVIVFIAAQKYLRKRAHGAIVGG